MKVWEEIKKSKADQIFQFKENLKKIQNLNTSILSKLMLRLYLFAKLGDTRKFKNVLKRIHYTTLLDNFSSGVLINSTQWQPQLEEINLFLSEWTNLMRKKVSTESYLDLLKYFSQFDFSFFKESIISKEVMKYQENIKNDTKKDLEFWRTKDTLFYYQKELSRDNFLKISRYVDEKYWKNYFNLKYCSLLSKSDRLERKIKQSCLKSQRDFFHTRTKNENFNLVNYFHLLKLGDYKAKWAL